MGFRLPLLFGMDGDENDCAVGGSKDEAVTAEVVDESVVVVDGVDEDEPVVGVSCSLLTGKNEAADAAVSSGFPSAFACSRCNCSCNSRC